jgi:ABC-2 type transport system ATP-binding protein
MKTTARGVITTKDTMTGLAGVPGIAARGVCKSFGHHLVLDKVNLTAAKGTILSLLGPNGAGKTTMVRILSTLIPADSGSMRIAGHDVGTNPDTVRGVIGVTGQFSAVDNLLTGTENLRLMADLRHLGPQAGRRRVAELLEQFDLVDAADQPLSTYSGGMRRRLDLAMTLVGHPSVIFLDEPTAGLDPRSRRAMWQAVRELASTGVTILLTTQYLDEADQLSDQIVVLDQGRVAAEGTPAELKARIPGGHVRLHFADPDLLRSASELLPAAAPDQAQLVLQAPAAGTADSLRDLLNKLHDAHIPVGRFTIHTPDLDDVFLAVTGAHVTGPAGEPTGQGAAR